MESSLVQFSAQMVSPEKEFSFVDLVLENDGPLSLFKLDSDRFSKFLFFCRLPQKLKNQIKSKLDLK